jgi:hypothetical protein
LFQPFLVEEQIPMGQEFHINMRQAEVLQHQIPPQVPSELSKDQPQDAYGVVQNPEENSTVAGLVAIYSNFLMLHALALHHFQGPAGEELVPEKKKPDDHVKS